MVKESLHGAQRPDERHRHFAAERFDDAAMAQVRVQEIRAAGGVPLVQPAVSGRLMAFTSVVDRSGAMLARVQQVADRTYPLGAGLSARAHTVAIDEELSRSVSRLLAELAWRGLSELQFMVEGNARPVLLDFNGRFYGSLSLALAAGVNLPDVWARAALGQPEGAGGGDAVPGVRYQWLTGDLKAVRESQASGLRELAGCLWHARHVHASSWRRDDPGPAIVEASSLLGQSVRVVARRVAHKQERPIASPR